MAIEPVLDPARTAVMSMDMQAAIVSRLATCVRSGPNLPVATVPATV